MKAHKMELITKEETSALYSIETDNHAEHISEYIFTHPDSRAICNDPTVYGVEYTSRLSTAVSALFSALNSSNNFHATEKNCTVFHILRGGLNFGIREALYSSLQWNAHTSAYISSQRAQKEDGSWHILEDSYEKIELPEITDIIVGDVVATGVSLQHAVERLISRAIEQKKVIRSFTFITIGGERSTEVMKAINTLCSEAFGEMFTGSAVIYLEGVFDVATDNDERLQIALGGTDLLRRDSILAPEFIESQEEDITYPLERCTIYDAGSRAFSIDEYLKDVREYWQQVLELVEQGVTLYDYLAERYPDSKFLTDNEWKLQHSTSDALKKVATTQLSNLQ